MLSQQSSLQNRAAIVTGAAGSLGSSIAFGLRDRGCRVVALDRDEKALAAFSPDEGIDTAVCDLLEPTLTDQRIGEAWDKHGPISILVNAVGSIYNAPLINMTTRAERRHSLESWRRVIDLNLTTMFSASAAVVDRMVSTRTRGVVINFSSIAARGNPGQGAYSAAKAGVEAATTAWAKELGILGIRFVAIAPGFIDTPSTHAALSESAVKDLIQRTPLRRLGATEDVMSAVAFAIDNAHLSGRIIEVDGGLTF
jgi:3-oxoacyl-[acyl-carrier protein] reductase